MYVTHPDKDLPHIPVCITLAQKAFSGVTALLAVELDPATRFMSMQRDRETTNCAVLLVLKAKEGIKRHYR